jgi:hypothetical protein
MFIMTPNPEFMPVEVIDILGWENPPPLPKPFHWLEPDQRLDHVPFPVPVNDGVDPLLQREALEFQAELPPHGYVRPEEPYLPGYPHVYIMPEEP